MKKKLSIIFVGTVVAVVAAVGAFAGIAAAQSNDNDGDSRTFVERVAEILGISSETVESAFAQAKEEMHSERIDAKFAELVENGTLTQAEADAIQTWQDSKPEVEFNLDGADGEGKRGWGHRGFGNGGGMWIGSEDKLDYLVEQGVITQADADSLTEWWDSRPDTIDELMPERDGKRGHGKRGWKCDKDSATDADSTETSVTDIDA